MMFKKPRSKDKIIKQLEKLDFELSSTFPDGKYLLIDHYTCSSLLIENYGYAWVYCGNKSVATQDSHEREGEQWYLNIVNAINETLIKLDKGEEIMSIPYNQYLIVHKANVQKGFEWLCQNLPELLLDEYDFQWQICMNHDHSKNEPDEYEAYDAYFYGGNKSYEVVQNFNKAWLLHIHRNPHHWQHWVLINDDSTEGEIILDMPYNYIIEMICDWWSFSWNTGNLDEIFVWYEKHKDIKLSETTRVIVESILEKIKDVLECEKNAM